MRFFKTVLLSQSFSLVDIFLKLVNILDLRITSTTYLLLITGQFKFKEGQHQFSFLTKLNLSCVSVEEIPFHNWRRGEQKSKEVGSDSSLQLSTGLQSEGEFSGRGLSVHQFTQQLGRRQASNAAKEGVDPSKSCSPAEANSFLAQWLIFCITGVMLPTNSPLAWN